MNTVQDAAKPRSIEVRTRGKAKSVLAQRALDWDVEIHGGLVRTCALKDEWYQHLDDPDRLVAWMREGNSPADIFTFIRGLPIQAPVYPWKCEMDNVAAIELLSYDDWWKHQIGSKTRALVRKAAKCGIETKVVPFTDQLIKEIESIYDETPIRQGKPFWHYKKGFDYLKELHATYLDRSAFIAAYFEDELVGFIKLVYSGETANTMHIISKHSHRDKAVSNGLIAKAVEIASANGSRYLVYDKYDYETGGSPTLQRFKKSNGFTRIDYPRFYVPLSWRGRISLALGMHKGVAAALPTGFVDLIRNARKRWYDSVKRSV